MITVQVEGRALVPSADMIAVEQDSGYETLQFEVPEIFPDGQTAYVMFQKEDGSTNTYMLGADGLWTLTSGLTNVPTKLAVFLRIISTSGQVWNSFTFLFRVHNNFDVTFGTVADDADTLNAALTVMSQYAVRAENAEEGAEAAQTGAETAQGAAETAQDAAEAAQEAAEAAQAAAETAQGKAETAQGNAQSAVTAAQAAQDAAEKAKAAAQTAQTEAEAAQTGAETAQDAAETAQDAAEASALAAQQSAQDAEAATDKLNAPIAQATTLPTGSEATASWDTSGETPVLHLGIPRGDVGPSGPGSGDMMTSTYDTNGDGKVDEADHADSAAALDSDAQVTMAQVSGLESALAGKQPTGNYLTEESDPTVPAWAKAQTKPTYTADEVGARPDTWTPTAAEVGAATASVLEVTLSAEGWTGDSAPYTQSVTVTGLSANGCICVVAPAEQSRETVNDCALQVSDELNESGQMVFTAEETPNAAITLIVVIITGTGGAAATRVILAGGAGSGGGDYLPLTGGTVSGTITATKVYGAVWN